MASTLKITLQEELSLEGVSYNGIRTKTISTIESVFKHIVSVTTAEGTILTFTDAGGDIATLDRDTVEYLRITNLDTTNFVVISLKDGSAAVAAVRLDAGRSLIIPTPNTTTEHPQFFVDDDAATHGTMLDIDTIPADADTDTCKIEIFCAMNA